RACPGSLSRRSGSRGGARRTWAAGSVVEDVLEDLARLEGQHAARADGDLLAGLGIAPGARVLVAHHEVPEPGDLDLLPALERLLDRVEHRLDDLGGLFLGEATHLLVDVLNNVRLRHDLSSISLNREG